jgi:hypothetical protein
MRTSVGGSKLELQNPRNRPLLGNGSLNSCLGQTDTWIYKRLETVLSVGSVQRLCQECLWMWDSHNRMEAGSNTSTVTLRVVGGDEKGSLKSETVKYGTRERLRWQGPAAYTNDRPVLSSERAPHENKTLLSKSNWLNGSRNVNLTETVVLWRERGSRRSPSVGSRCVAKTNEAVQDLTQAIGNCKVCELVKRFKLIAAKSCKSSRLPWQQTEKQRTINCSTWWLIFGRRGNYKGEFIRAFNAVRDSSYSIRETGVILHP